MFLENKYLSSFDCMLKIISAFTTIPRYWQIRVEYILANIASPLDRDEVILDMMLTNMKNDLFPLIPTIIFPKGLTPCFPVHLDTLVVIYWNSCVALEYHRKINGHISVIQNHGCNVGQQACGTFVFHK